jgi:hypothetical protein
LEHDLELPGIAVWFNVVDFCDIGDSCDRKNLVCRDPFEVGSMLLGDPAR